MPDELDELRARRARVGARFGWGVGGLLVVVAAAGADRPPPPGFVVIVLIAAVLGWAVRWWIPRVLGMWDSRGAATALGVAGAAGLTAGALAWGALALASGFGPSGAPAAPHLLLGLALVAGLGSVGVLALSVLARSVDQRNLRHS